jgi:hypothetical protein
MLLYQLQGRRVEFRNIPKLHCPSRRRHPSGTKIIHSTPRGRGKARGPAHQRWPREPPALRSKAGTGGSVWSMAAQ